MAPSLRRNLVLLLLALTLATWFIAVVITGLLSRQLVVRQVERQLLQYMAMAQHTQASVYRNEVVRRYYWENTPALSRHAGITRFRGFGDQGLEQAINLWFGDSHVVLGEAAPAFPRPLQEGFTTWVQTTEQGSKDWRILSRHDVELGIWIAVGVDLKHATAIGRTTLIQATAPLLVILPLTVLIVLWGARRGLQPLNRLAERIEARERNALDPIDVEDIPVEVRPVVDSLNGLLDRLRRALESESRFTANAAHELQTPLAAIRAEVQRHQRRGHPESQEMLADISTRVTRAANTVSQLLTLARLDPEQSLHYEPVELYELILDNAASEGAVAAERKLDIRLPERSPATVQGHRDWLNIMVRNLIANAFGHTPPGGTVEISLEEKSGKVILAVANDYPPIDDASLRQLPDRFYTLPGNEAAGAGLGISIVERIAEQHNARMELGRWQSGEGFRVSVEFTAGQ